MCVRAKAGRARGGGAGCGKRLGQGLWGRWWLWERGGWRRLRGQWARWPGDVRVGDQSKA